MEQRTKNDAVSSAIDCDFSIGIDEAFNILDRTIGFIRNCDNKASIYLGIVVAFLAIICDDRLLIVKKFICCAFCTGNISKIVISVAIIVSAVLIILGLCLVVAVLFTVTRPYESHSLIFFGSISRLKEDEYKSKLLNVKKPELLNDIIVQIHINSKICHTKHRLYKTGFFICSTGILLAIFILGCLYFFVK